MSYISHGSTLNKSYIVNIKYWFIKHVIRKVVKRGFLISLLGDQLISSKKKKENLEYGTKGYELWIWY